MRTPIRAPLLLAALALACAAPGTEQAAESAAVSAAGGSSVTADLLNDIVQVEGKMMGLANAIPAEKYDWRPTGARSIAEVLKHVAADNYLLPAALGHAPDTATGIRGDDYNTAVAFEKREMSRDAILAELQKSFAFVKASLENAQPASLGNQVSLFGQTFTGQQVWIIAATHLHEHLGQMIAYARSNGIAPPWSN
ncbi:MAG TPA: DinB family protein [Gemmatimonadaceae bacterium]|nr:DinB family protein [Gemmatimonadaceae bacterium]